MPGEFDAIVIGGSGLGGLIESILGSRARVLRYVTAQPWDELVEAKFVGGLERGGFPDQIGVIDGLGPEGLLQVSLDP